MSAPRNIGHVDADLTPRDLTASLSDNSYEAQFSGLETYWYVGGAAAPTDEDDWHLMQRGASLRFRVETGAAPIWTRAVRTETAGPIVLRRWPNHTFAHPNPSFPHVAITSTPADLRVGLPEGDYRGKIRGLPRTGEILMYIGNAMPSSLDDWWIVGAGSVFAICAGDATDAVWARTRTTAETAIVNIGS